MKASDYIARFLASKAKHCFGLQGGAAVHLFNSFEALGPKPIYCHHEQAAALAAVAYARISGYGVCVVTTGPGGTNSLTGLLAAWQDYIPCMFISGQQRSDLTSYGKGVRQVGSQEAPIIELVRPITKFAQCVEKSTLLLAALENAYRWSLDGDSGPVWLDICQDAQWDQC